MFTGSTFNCKWTHGLYDNNEWHCWIIKMHCTIIATEHVQYIQSAIADVVSNVRRDTQCDPMGNCALNLTIVYCLLLLVLLFSLSKNYIVCVPKNNKLESSWLIQKEKFAREYCSMNSLEKDDHQTSVLCVIGFQMFILVTFCPFLLVLLSPTLQ